MSTSNVAQLERQAFCAALLEAGPQAPTLCEGWLTRDLAAHIVVREARPDLAGGILVPVLASRLAAGQRAIAEGDWTALVERVRKGPPVWNPARLPFLDDLVNLVEFTVHTEDVVRGAGGDTPGPRRDVPADVTAAVWRALGRSGRLLLRRSPVPVTLVAPDFGEFRAGGGSGTGVTLTGAPIELLLTAYGRDRAADTVWTGDASAIEELRGAPLGLV